MNVTPLLSVHYDCSQQTKLMNGTFRFLITVNKPEITLSFNLNGLRQDTEK